MAVCFPAEQLTILDYNRVVKDLNGLSEEDFLKALEKNFTVACKGEENYRPQKMHEFSLYVGGNGTVWKPNLERSTKTIQLGSWM